MKNTTVTIPFLILICGLVIGIILGYQLSIENTTLLIAGLGLSILTLAFLKIWANKNPNKAHYFGIAICPAFVTLGLLLVQLHNPLSNSDHYTQKTNPLNNSHPIVFKIQERLKPTKYYRKYTVALKQIDTVAVQGTILLYIEKDSLTISPNIIGRQFVTHTRLEPVPTPLNPYQFDYAKYLKRKNIYHQIRLNTVALIPLQEPTPVTLKDHASALRVFILQKLSSQGISPKTLAITKALLLGQRQDIDLETYQNYINAGAVHILAVSGLHIGIFLWLFNLLLLPLTHIKHGQTIRLLLVILLLWAYAFLTGLSPSVLRAVTMFSFIAIGQVIRSKKGSNYNALLISAFILLCFDPLLLFDVGFQLSYAAVFAIFWIQPLIATCYRPHYFMDHLYWDTLTVTIAAQLGVLPLSIYYFHQFPLLFFVTNLAIVPLLGLLLGFGLLVILVATFDQLPDFLAHTYNTLVESMNTLVAWVADKEQFLWSNISLSITALIIGYGVLVSGVIALKKFKSERIYRFGILLTLFLIVLIWEKIHTNQQDRLIIFHKYKTSLLGHQAGNQLSLFQNDSLSSQTLKYISKPFSIACGIKSTSLNPLKNAYRYKEQNILLIDGSGLYGTSTKSAILILTQSAKINLDRAIDSLQPTRIVADGSNYPSSISRWEATCKKRQIPFYSTKTSGALILE